jgi:CheY-like chemotaxis protein
VDDSTYNLFVIEMLIQELNDPRISVITALNGDLAVQTVLASPHPFSHILLDLHMPVMDGYQVSLWFF